MIISTSNLSMSSSHMYSKNVQASKTTTFTGALDSSKRMVDHTSSGFSYSEIAKYNLHSNAFATYNSLGKENADSIQSDMQAQGGDPKQILSSAENISSALNVWETDEKADKTVLKRTFISLLEMLEKARFKSKFKDSEFFRQFTSDPNDLNGVLKLTSSAQPQLWYKQEVNSYFMEEKETTAFSTTGNVVTADGRNISFNVTMEMSRSFSESYEFCEFYNSPQILTDPLIINLDSNPSSISDKVFLFDIDADGDKDEISQLSGGNGYLSLDKNGDGIINDGSELFGPSTGNGFNELASYDSDKNGWIDEADEVYQKLKVWTKDRDGKDVLLSLKDADIGAIGLTNTKTRFSLTDDTNKLRGQVQSTGVYLRESGGSGTIQQVDF